MALRMMGIDAIKSVLYFGYRSAMPDNEANLVLTVALFPEREYTTEQHPTCRYPGTRCQLTNRLGKRTL